MVNLEMKTVTLVEIEMCLFSDSCDISVVNYPDGKGCLLMSSPESEPARQKGPDLRDQHLFYENSGAHC